VKIPFPLLFVLGAALVVRAQSHSEANLDASLKRLFPATVAFSPKGGNPPHWKAFLNPPGPASKNPTGFAFLTTELEPLERGYDGPIKVLVGMDTNGVLTSIVVVEHREPYGSWSIMTPEFAAQFKGKNIRDSFKVGGDIDAISRATISVTSATRAVRNSARRIARQVLPPQP
jgi:NosR/NirI family nitrous oxide reductase transcriptional regulator